MKTLILTLAAGAAALSLGACATDEGYGHRAYYGGAVGYDGFYDDAYGPFYDGYWGGDGFFYYSDAAGHPFRRDDAHHFRHDQAGGYHAVHGSGHAGPGDGGRHRDHDGDHDHDGH
ncbi:hypothetical protein ACO2Q3_05990 [Caulobacter sp. KR2-114]|uniref:hypothetical protein n=1 Tax=Caulobacter sp. KR2-114 TaxID=3400912 RepID=UPI003C123F24